MNLPKWLFALLMTIGFGVQLFAQVAPGAAPPQSQNQPRQRENPKQAEQVPGNAAAPQSYDPMTFYRKNPELMKRYFPHLFHGQPEAAPNAESERGQALDYFEFKGGTAQELVQSLKRQFKPAPNVIIPPKLKDTPIPEFELQNVTLADMFQALNSLSEDKSVHWQLSGSSEPIWVLNPINNANNPYGQPGFPGGGYPGGMNAVDPVTGMPINTRTCKILPVGKYLKEYKIEDITTAVKTAWGMMGDESGAQMKYHTDTKLLIVVGTPEQLNVLTQVLSSLEQNPKSGPEMSEIQIPTGSKAKF